MVHIIMIESMFHPLLALTPALASSPGHRKRGREKMSFLFLSEDEASLLTVFTVACAIITCLEYLQCNINCVC